MSDGNSRQANLGLGALAAAAFVYVTAETLPVGLLPQLSAGLHVNDGAVGLLVTAYAAVAGLTAVPLTAWTTNRPRRQLVVVAVGLLAVTQFAMALAPNYAMVVAARAVCAMAHGVFWSVLAPVAVDLVPGDRAGRATAIVFTGNSLALVLGTPIATALGQLLGWRVAVAVVGVVSAVAAAGLMVALPSVDTDTVTGNGPDRLAAIPAALRNRSLLGVCLVTVLVVVGHFTVYTYISGLVRRDAGLTGLALSAVLLGYGVAGIVGIAAVGRVTDRRPRLAAVGCAGAVTLALAALSTVGRAGVVGTLAAVVLWGAAFTAIPVCFQSAVLRIAPDNADTASALYVVAFQIGIGGGALAGSGLVDSGRLLDLPVVGTVVVAAGALALIKARVAFPARQGAR